MRPLQIIFILFFLCIESRGYSQAYADNYLNKNKSDSLLRLIAKTPNDTLKIIWLIEVSSLQYYQENPTTDFALKALSLSEKLHYKEGVARAYHAIGCVYEFKKDPGTAIKYYQQAIDLSESIDYYSYSAGFYAVLLNIFFYLGDYPKAMETISREMNIAEKFNDKRRIMHCHNILGYIYFKQENFKESEKYYDLYINGARELNDDLLLAHAMGEVSDVYIQEKKYLQSKNTLFTCIQICDRLMVAPGIQNRDSINGFVLQYKAKALYRLGVTYKLAGELQQALHYALEALKLTDIGLNKYDVASYYINAGDVYKELKEFKKAINCLRFGFDLSTKIGHRENVRDAAEYLSQTYALLHRYDSAFYFYRRFTNLKDSIVNNETKMKIAGIQGQYDVAKKDKQILRQKELNYIITGSFIFLLVLLLLMYRSYRLKQKNKSQQEQNQQQNELFNAIVTTQDQERKRIAQDIHDSLGSLLSAARLKLSSLEESKQQLSPDQLQKYQSSLALLDEASAELRNISHNIMPATLSKLGIVAALQNLIDKLSSKEGIHISFTAHGFEERIEETTEISIYRIILELINNTVKHAMAGKVTIQLIKYPDYINLIMEDNGRGFDYEKVSVEKKGIGLGNILSRVEYLRGTIEFDSSPGNGTTIIIEIPIDHDAINTNILV
jgi:two-component system NarL family sensor kinase